MTSTPARESRRHTEDPHDEAKPDSLRKLTGPSWKYLLRRTVRKFSLDQCTDLAAAMTYFAVLSLLPAVIALLSLLGVLGQDAKTIDTFLKIVTDIGGASVADAVSGPLTSLTETPGVGVAFVIGLATALWSASGYIGAFGRAMNRIYQIEEGRPIWKLRPTMLVITLITVTLAVAAALILVLSGPIVSAVGAQIGLSSTALLVWSIAKWPVLLLIVTFIVAFLYHATPNVQQPKFKFISLGAALAIIIWILASALFGLYLATFASYNKTYGSMAGVIVFLLWLWLTNLALLFGAVLNAEVERARELQAGKPAEETIQLPARDTTNIDKAGDKRDEDRAKAHALRTTRGRSDDPDEIHDARPTQPDSTETDIDDLDRETSMTSEAPGSTTAKILYRPMGLAGSIVGGVVAGRLVKVMWKKARPGDHDDTPKALESEFRLREIVAAAALQGMVFAVVKAMIDRGGARVFQRVTGEWPGD